MNPRLRPICPRQTRCKCCGGLAFAYGVVDFHKNCETRRRIVLGISGVPIYYHRCTVCRFIFTAAFDEFTTEDFQRYIYNEEYPLVDPDYLETRPRDNAAILSSLFSLSKPRRILDYGGGNGVLSGLLRAAGFALVETYDPFVQQFSARPTDRFDCIVCFEVLEHAIDPARAIAEMSELLADSGVIIFSTLLQPVDIDRQGLSWWYASPRNGHVSLFSRMSLETLVQPQGLRLGSFNEGLHVSFRGIPEFARHFIVG
jgi:2-polyprenyl-6-hydroxyphenyl methylase/3-demethylubiquinone-9 3-methyltransferase